MRSAWFTDADICETGRLLPGLMTGLQANSRAEDSTAEVAAEGEPVEAMDLAPEVTDDDFASFLNLTSVR